MVGVVQSREREKRRSVLGTTLLPTLSIHSEAFEVEFLGEPGQDCEGAVASRICRKVEDRHARTWIVRDQS